MNQSAQNIRGSLGAQAAVTTAAERVQTAVHVVRGRKALLTAQPILQALAARCGQAGEVDALAQFLEVPGALPKRPWLVLLGENRAEPMAAVWAFEYRVGPVGTKVFASADGTGRRNVLAAPADRARVSAVAARTLMEHGGQVVHLAFNERHCDGLLECEAPDEEYAMRALARAFDGHRENGQQWSFARQQTPMYLPLLASFDQTLARIGQKTRANLRYYRRRCEHDLGCSYVPEVGITVHDFVALNARCHYAVDARTARKRHASVQQPGMFLAGILDRGGAWLSLIGGRRQNGVIEIDWQMNRKDLPQYSLSTVGRSYLIEAEIARGTRRLYIEGGTPNSLQRSFVQEPVCELTVRRESAYVRALRRLGGAVFPEKNYVGQILQRQDLVWHAVKA